MPNPNDPETNRANQPAGEPDESFKDLLSQYEQSHTRTPQEGSKGLEGTVVKVTADAVLLDIGFKTEGILPLTALRANETVKPGDKMLVAV
jgi:small subunit ribosomal protein S1